MKAQAVRVADVLVIGPAMIAGGSVVYKHAYSDGAGRALGAFLIFAGVGTMIYNGNNWLKGEAARDAAAQAAAKQPAAPPVDVSTTTTPPAPLAPRG